MRPSRPTRVVLLIDELETRGGTENHLIDLLSGLDRARIDPTVVVLTAAGLLPEIAQMGISTEALGVTSLFGRAGLRAMARLVGVLRARRPDLVVTYHPSSDLVGPVGARAIGTRVISCRRDLGFTRERKHRLLQPRMNRLVDGMITVSDAVRREVARTEGYAASRIRVIPNGCDLDVYRPTAASVREELGIGKDEVVVGTLSNFGPIKGYDVIVPAAMEIVRARPNVRFLLVGKDEVRQNERARFVEMARPVGDRILFPGSRRDVPQVLCAMDVFLQASHSEGFSNSILQAMACARPVVATDVGGNPELVDPASGFLVPLRDGRALIESVGRLLDDPAARERMGAAGRTRATDLFSKALMIERYEKAFSSLARFD